MKRLSEQTIFEKSRKGCGTFSREKDYFLEGINKAELPSKFMRKQEAGLPDVSERDIVSHYTNLAQRMFSVDANFYPLGSCTMKYNPKINEDISGYDGFINIHPMQDEEDIQGTLKLLYDFERELCYICGMDSFTLQPAAGAHGELTAMYIAKKYFEVREEKRKKIVVPDSSHGTNPASAALAGFNIVTIPSKDGEVDLEALQKECDSDLAVFMLTNPNTLGLFEKNIKKICDMVHSCGALTYMDGANMNALLGLCRPGDMGFDMLHVNLHKSFSTPHGGGGPGSGPVGVKHHLTSFLPVPFITEDEGKYRISVKRENSIGAVKAFYGNFNVILKAAVYVDSLGLQGLQETSEAAIINANYMRKRLGEIYTIPYNRPCMHEFVMTPNPENCPAKTLDLAKRLLDFGIHSPTVYFPLIVKEAIMIEPTETESKQTLDEFIEIMFQIAEEAKADPEKMHQAPFNTFRARLDEVQAARTPVLQWKNN